MRTKILSLSAVLLLSAWSPALAAEICLVPSPNGLHHSVDCDPSNPALHPNAHIGYSQTGPPCQFTASACIDGGETYGWSISASDVDPHVNSGPLPIGVATLYLWMYCNLDDGVAAVEFSFATDDPNFFVVGLQPAPNVLNAGTPVNPLLAISGCPDAPLLTATLTLLNLGPVSTESGTWGGIKAMYR